jgi:opacity protein-like surface antigen
MLRIPVRKTSQRKKERKGMKKIAALTALALTVSAAAFALPELKLSFGGGGILSVGLGNGARVEAEGKESKITTGLVGGGGGIFVDATFAELGFAFLGGQSNTKANTIDSSGTKGTFSALDMSLLGKYPISLGPIAVFPLLGIDYQIVVSLKTGAKKSDSPGDLNLFGLNFGGGLDFALTDRLFLRGEFLYALRLPSKYQKDIRDMFEEDFGDGAAKYVLGHGPIIKLAVGYSL